MPVEPLNSSDIQVYVDGRYLGKKTLVAPDGIFGSVVVFTPWLQPGGHTVRLYWENVHSRVSLRIRDVHLQRLGGPDADGDGVKDWVAASIGNMTSFDAVRGFAGSLSQSVVSPVCIEGAARYVDMMGLRVGGAAVPGAVRPGATGRWYADVALSPSGSTAVDVEYQGGALHRSRSIAWTALNLLDGAGDLKLRKGDSLKLTAVPAGGGAGVVTINVGGTAYTTDAATPVVHRFDAAGTFTNRGTGK